ncbi:MAG TPA: phosphoribosyltransferase family protein [Syntrophales bacterium]|nr:phosphoribosyltransferase family protein [Syntrophales bacterium]HOX94280.1 phosphoribosyltransferase family protein [Syntrophales bacterium]HPI56214.1 phosphoribosyltransferase family protein [Syntrophales bacterium]HQM29032.1 phosphoribosyltransferase family protein [Syntrophales bacterium]
MAGERVAGNVIELPELRDRVRVFRDRAHAGEILAGMLDGFRSSRTLVMAIPAGGIPVAAALALRLSFPLDVAVVSKITLPWNTEAGYGAVAFDGTVRLNRDLLPRFGLSEKEIEAGKTATAGKVKRRVEKFRGNRPYPDFIKERVILVDDGLASGFTLLVGVEALKKIGTGEIVVAVPTGSAGAVRRVAAEVDRLYCANIRGGWSFAVADAYERWSDVSEEEALRIFDAALSTG